MYNSVLPLSPLQTTITSSLDYIESQQSDLSSILDAYEAQIGDLVDQSSTSSAGLSRGGSAAEKEREQAYQLASTLSNSLDSTSSSLTSLIQTLNALSPALAPGADGTHQDDPLTQIAAILNAHLGSLKWIEGTTDQLRKNVSDLEGRVGDVQGKIGASQGRVGGTGSQNGTPVRGSAFGASQLGRSTASPFARRL